MKVVDGKIIEATEAEVYKLYVERDYDMVMSFDEYKYWMMESGVNILDE